MTNNEAFYSNMKPFVQFRGICNPENFFALPKDWSIVITDIESSTLAIQQGRYRQVNAVGVASIVAIINAMNPVCFPFIFGGDGAALCIPNSYLSIVKSALLATQIMAKEQFALSLRVGIVPSSVVEQSQFQVLVGKCKVSEGYDQAAFSGEGLSYAEHLVKNDPHGLYSISIEDESPQADFNGFECRWKDVPSPHGETVSLLVKASANKVDQNNAVYLDTINTIQRIYGDAEMHKPVQKEYLELTTKAKDLEDEVKIMAASQSKFINCLYALTLPFKVRLGRYWMNKGAQALETDWGKYKESLVTNTDFRKFDDNLRMVISGSTEQRERLESYLEKQYKKDLLIYGLHVSDRALMTCVISDYCLHHIHFIDGSDGGYAKAAEALKKQLKPNWVSKF